MSRSTTSKVVSLDEIDRALTPHRARKSRIVHCHGVFDVVHLGHLRYFAAAKALGDTLVVSLTADRFVRRGPGRPFFSHQQRAEMLAALAIVDFVCVVDEPTAVPAIKAIKPSFYVKGPDYRNKSGDVTGKIFEEEDAVRSVGGELTFTDDITFSSSQLINSAIDRAPEESLTYLRAIGARWSADQLTTRLHQLHDMRVLVIGALVGEEGDGGPVRLANQCAALGAKVELLLASRSGDAARNVTTQLAPQVTLLGVSRDPSDAENHSLLEDTLQRAKDVSATLVWDTEPGAFADSFRCELSRAAPFLAIGTGGVKSSLGAAPVLQYPHCQLLCIDEPEMRILFGRKRSALPELMAQLTERNQCDTLLLSTDTGICRFSGTAAEHIPLFTRGALPEVNETLFAYGALLLASGLDPVAAAFVATAAGTNGGSPHKAVTPVDLAKFITRLLKV